MATLCGSFESAGAQRPFFVAMNLGRDFPHPGQCSMVANRTLRGMFPEQDMAHIALIHIDQLITLRTGECDS